MLLKSNEVIISKKHLHSVKVFIAVLLTSTAKTVNQPESIRRMGEETVPYILGGILYIQKNQCNHVVCSKMCGLTERYVEVKLNRHRKTDDV